MDGADFLEYLEIQGNLDLVSKSELMDELRGRGVRVRPRQLTTWITEGLVPRSARFGSRSGAFPKIVIEVVEFVAVARERGLSVEAVRELLPIFKALKLSLRQQKVNIAELQVLAQGHVRKPEAIFSVPWVVQWVLPCPSCTPDQVADLTFVFKDGSEHRSDAEEFLALGFVVEREVEDDNCALPVAWMRVDLTPVDPRDPSAIVLSLPTAENVDEDDQASMSQGSAIIGSSSSAPELN